MLEPDKAFALTTRVVDGNTTEASWKIAPGYYLYRDKFKFESLDPAVALKPAVLPAGKVKDDQFFGRTEIYTKSVSVRVPDRAPAGRQARGKTQNHRSGLQRAGGRVLIANHEGSTFHVTGDPRRQCPSQDAQ